MRVRDQLRPFRNSNLVLKSILVISVICSTVGVVSVTAAYYLCTGSFIVYSRPNSWDYWGGAGNIRLAIKSEGRFLRVLFVRLMIANLVE